MSEERKKERPAGSAERQGVVAGRRGCEHTDPAQQTMPEVQERDAGLPNGAGMLLPELRSSSDFDAAEHEGTGRQIKEEKKHEAEVLTDKELSQVVGGVNVQVPLDKQCPKCKDGKLVFQTGLGCFCPNCGYRESFTQQNMRVQST